MAEYIFYVSTTIQITQCQVIQALRFMFFITRNGSILQTDPIYQPVMAGNARHEQKSAITGDDSGENISIKNPYYSELTGIYWAWKNTKQDVTGSCHYRRFFTAQPEPFLYKLKRLLYYPAGLYKKRYGLIYTEHTHFFCPSDSQPAAVE